MEHVIQIGINVDDDAIRKAAIDQAAKLVAKKMEDEMFKKTSYGSIYAFSGIFENLLADSVDKYKEEIIERTAKLLADSIRRSKKFKEKIAEMTGEVENGRTVL